MNAALVLAVAVETAAFLAPPGWVRGEIDAAHATLGPQTRTVEKWTRATPDGSSLYYAVGEAGGAALDAYVAAARRALPAGTRLTADRTASLCDGQTGRVLVFASGATIAEEVVAVAGDVVAIARYERSAALGEDEAARKSVEALCPQAETPADS